MQFKTQYATTAYNEKDEWRTPDYIFAPLNDMFHFTVDAAANMENTKCQRFFSIEDNGLNQSWANERVFCNPPHTSGQYGAWLRKAADEYTHNLVTSAIVVPFNLETAAFRPAWDSGAFLILPYKRIKYLRSDRKTSSPTFYSAIVIFCLHQLSMRAFDNGITQIGRVINLRLVHE